MRFARATGLETRLAVMAGKAIALAEYSRFYIVL
jgi:hypothetical protein